MTLVSFSYYAFIIVALVLYYLIPKRWQWCVLLAASLAFFCLAGSPITILYPIASIIITWFSAKKIQQARDNEESNIRPSFWLAMGLIVNFGILAILKYANFFLKNASFIYNWLSGNEIKLTSSMIAALGISFYTLQIVGYLLDCYWGMIDAQPNIGKLALYTMFFPQMVSGPISRYSQLGEQLFTEHSFEWDNIRSGFFRILSGTFKKLVVAENFAVFVPQFLNAENGRTGPVALAGMIMYVIQIYADFAGCMDIVLGTAQCFGITMVENFNYPFLSRSIQEFWQRWHITLGLWLRDYIMYPLLRSKKWSKLTKSCKKKFGKKAAKKIPTYLAMLILWFGMGLWHGGWWNYILEGVWFWAVIVIGDWCDPLFKKVTSKFNNENKLWVFFQRARTALIYSIGAIMFKFDSVSGGLTVLRNIFSPLWITDISAVKHPITSLITEGGILKVGCQFGFLVFSFLIFVFINHREKKKGSLAEDLKGKPIMFQALCAVAMVYGILVFGIFGPGFSAADFIYGGF